MPHNILEPARPHQEGPKAKPATMLADTVDEFLNDVCAGKTNETPIAYRRKLGRLVDFLGHDYKPTALTIGDLNNFRSHLQQRTSKRRGRKIVKGALSPVTIHTVLATVRHFVRWLYAAGYLTTDISKNFKVPQLPPADPKAVSTLTVQQLVAAAHKHSDALTRNRNLAIIFVLRSTGGRLGGLINASIGDLDLKRRRLRVREKGNKLRTLHLGDEAIAALRAYLSTRPDFDPTSEALFVSRSGERLARGSVHSIFRRLAKHIPGIGRYNPHSFRHAFAREAIQAGADLSEVSQMLGHTTVATTVQFYIRWDDEDLHRLHQKYSPKLPRLPII